MSVLGALAFGTTHASAQPSDTGPASREAAFSSAAQEFGVPQRVLKALSYSQTRWEAHAGEHNTDGGYGPMNLLDGTLFAADAAEAKDGTDGTTDGPVPQTVDTLGRAAKILGVDRDVLRKDAAANIRGGAALLAAKQKSLGLAVGAGSDPGQWYAAVADVSGSREEKTAGTFADDAYAVLTAGAARTTADGKAVALEPTAVTPQRGLLAKLNLHKAKDNPNIECPSGLDCEWIPAPYQELGDGDYGNHDLDQRGTPAGPTVDYIIVHDTEASWNTTLKLVQDPTYVSWHYSLRSSDGHIAQHVATKDVAWHAGNWYMNTHSIGLEHEGFAATGATWYTESLYRSSARLVRYLAKKYNIPMDSAHIIGHDQIPGITPAYVRGMHWDPGPYWDWEHYFQLMGAPLSARHGAPSQEIVRILPGFEDNQQVITGCTSPGVVCAPQGANFVYLHTQPDPSSPLVKDIGLHPDGSASTTQVSDIGARAMAGTEYAVADRQGEWTAIWYLGQKAWFFNPRSDRTAINVGGSYVVPKAGKASVPVYGRAYPEAAAYTAYPGIPVQAVVPLQYSILAGQRAVLTDGTVSTDYYRATTFDTPPPADHVDIVGQDRYYQVSFGHRISYVRAADVDIVQAR
jgi:hypothetical protein